MVKVKGKEPSELDFYIWNAKWPMKCEAKMATHEGQFCTSVLVSRTTFYTFLKSFL